MTKKITTYINKLWLRYGNVVWAFGLSVLFMMLVLFSGCKTQECVPEVITRDSIRIQNVLDSVYLYEKDSIYIHQKADTVIVDKWHTRYKDKILLKTDTLYKDKTVVQTKTVKYTPAIYKWSLGILIVLIVAIIVYTAIKIYLKFR